MSVVYFLLFGAVGAMTPFMTLHFKALGLSGTEIGILLSVAPGLLFLSQPVLGPLTDRSGHRGRMLGRLLLAVAVAGTALSFGTTFWTLLPLMGVWAFFHGSLVPIADSIALGEMGRTGVSYTRLRLWGSVGFLITTAVLGRLYRDLRWAFLVYGLLNVIAWLGTRRLPPEGIGSKRPVWPQLLKAIRNPLLVAFLVCSGVLQLTQAAHSAFFSIHMQSLGGTASTVGLAWSLAALAEVILWLAVGQANRRVSPLPLLAAAAGFYSLRWFAHGAVTSVGALLWLQVLQSVTYGIFMPTAVVFMGELMPAELRTSGQALLMLVNGGVAAVAGTLAAGRIVDQVGTAGLYAGISYVAAVAGVGFLLLLVAWHRSGKGEVRHG